MGEFGDEYKYPTKKEPSSKPLLGGQNVGPDGDAGENATFAVAFTNNILIPTDSDGTNPVYTDAITEFETWEGNVMLASKSSLDGWTSVLHSSSNVTVDDTVDFEATITAIAADYGSFIMKFEKVGYNTLYCKVHVHKAKKGVAGDTGTTGDTGDTGADGPTGPTGADGTGLVTVKKSITMLNYSSYLVNGTNSGGLLFTSNQPHEMEIGGSVHHYNFTVGAYNGDFKVVEVGSPTTYRIETIAYSSDDSGDGYSLSNIRDVANDNPQDLRWYDMIPVGTALIEFRLLMVTDDDEDEIYAYLGYHENPNVGWNYYLNGELFEEEGDQKANPAFAQPYIVNSFRGIASPSAQRKDIFLRLVPYTGKNWTTTYQAVRFNLFAAYLNYNPDTLGT